MKNTRIVSIKRKKENERRTKKRRRTKSTNRVTVLQAIKRIRKAIDLSKVNVEVVNVK